MTELFINNKRLDIANSPITQTFQINNMADVKYRQAGFTNHFKIPRTANNINIFEGLGISGNTSDILKRKIEVTLYSNGTQIEKGFLHIQGLDDNNYDCLVIFGNKGIQQKFGAKKVSSLSLSEFDHFTSDNIIQNSKNHDSGYIYPVVNPTNLYYFYAVTGDLFNSLTTKCLYVHTLWDKMFAEAGLQYTGDVFLRDDFKKLVLACGDKENINMDTVSLQVEGVGYPNGGIIGHEHFAKRKEPFSYPNILTYYNHEYTFNMPNEGFYKMKFRVAFKDIPNLDIDKNDVSLTITIGDNTFTVKNTNNLDTSTTDKELYFNTLTQYINKNDTIKFALSGEAKTQVDDGHDNDEVTLSNIDFFSFFYKATPTSEQVPDLNQIDLIKEITQRFALTYRIKDNTIEFKEMQELLSKNNAEDWSEKYITHKEIYKIGEYAQQNKFKYKYNNKGDNFANGILSIDNENLNPTKTILESKTLAPPTTQPFGVDICNLGLWKITTEENKTKIEQTKQPPIIGAIKRNDTDTYFDFKSCYYQYYVDRYYNAFSKILNNQKKIIAKFMLDVYDIYNLDFFRTKYIKQTGRYYYLSKVKNFIDDKRPTECELIEIP